jgi:hypothetical protein
VVNVALGLLEVAGDVDEGRAGAEEGDVALGLTNWGKVPLDLGGVAGEVRMVVHDDLLLPACGECTAVPANGTSTTQEAGR